MDAPRRFNPDSVAIQLAALSRDEIKPRLLDFPSRTRLDFTEEFLEKLSTDQLRHILFAAILCLSPN